MWPFGRDECDHDWEDREKHYPSNLAIDEDGKLSVSATHKDYEWCSECGEERYVDKTYTRYQYEPTDSAVYGGARSMDHYDKEGDD